MDRFVVNNHTAQSVCARLRILLVAVTLWGCAGGSQPANGGTVGQPCDQLTPCGADAVCDYTQGVCVATGTAVCGAGNCNGCCDNGRCELGSSDRLCGRLGQPCADCTAQRMTCVLGSCQQAGACTPDCAGKCPGAPDGCGASCTVNSCGGCCNGTSCIDPPTASQCGKSGEPCQDCGTGSCAADGSCSTAPPTCDASNCDGCCNGTSCVDPVTDSQCGKSGEPCQNCGTGSCTADGSCTTVPTCTSSNCDGCCNGTSCVTAINDTYCGINGADCESCDSDQICWASDGKCHTKATCTSSNCSGCCDGTNCVDPPTDTQCGTGGGACQSCASGTSCFSDGECYSCGPADHECSSSDYLKSCTGGTCFGAGCCCPTARQCRAGSFPVCCPPGEVCKNTATGECG